MTNADLAAARQRLEQRQRDLDDARTALAVVEHQAYADALQLIADEAQTADDSLNPGASVEAIDNIRVVLTDLGITPSPKPQQPVAVRR